MDNQDIMLCLYALLLCAVVLEELEESDSEDESPPRPSRQNGKSANGTTKKMSRPSTSAQGSSQRKRRLDNDEERPQKVSKYDDTVLLKEEDLDRFFTEETHGVVGIKLENGEELLQHIKTENVSVKREQEDISSDSETAGFYE